MGLSRDLPRHLLRDLRKLQLQIYFNYRSTGLPMALVRGLPGHRQRRPSGNLARNLLDVWSYRNTVLHCLKTTDLYLLDFLSYIMLF